jgi:hypothetical protein
MDLEKDLREFVELLNALNVRYLVVGAFAVAYHGYPRYTADIDLFIERSDDNAERLVQVIEKFGFGDLNLSVEDFLQEDQVIQLGISPSRIDLLTFNGLKVPFISKKMLKQNKAASGRTQDLADLEHL